ncbi:MAG TPA: hypothetical protein VKZ43_03125 [Trueperaceae bacterium]|nr:hypothetical protein [Trueperaceae bacterium]
MRRLIVAALVMVLGTVALAQAPTYFVKADMVRGAQGAMGPVCVPNSVFFNGEMIVFRAVVYDAATGEELLFDEIQARGITATVVMDGREGAAMFFPPPGGGGEGEDGPPPGADFFRGPWAIPADFPTGMYTWHIEVTDDQGNTATFDPISGAIGLNNITIQAAN